MADIDDPEWFESTEEGNSRRLGFEAKWHMALVEVEQLRVSYMTLSKPLDLRSQFDTDDARLSMPFDLAVPCVVDHRYMTRFWHVPHMFWMWVTQDPGDLVEVEATYGPYTDTFFTSFAEFARVAGITSPGTAISIDDHIEIFPRPWHATLVNISVAMGALKPSIYAVFDASLTWRLCARAYIDAIEVGTCTPEFWVMNRYEPFKFDYRRGPLHYRNLSKGPSAVWGYWIGDMHSTRSVAHASTGVPCEIARGLRFEFLKAAYSRVLPHRLHMCALHEHSCFIRAVARAQYTTTILLSRKIPASLAQNIFAMWLSNQFAAADGMWTE